MFVCSPMKNDREYVKISYHYTNCIRALGGRYRFWIVLPEGQTMLICQGTLMNYSQYHWFLASVLLLEPSFSVSHANLVKIFGPKSKGEGFYSWFWYWTLTAWGHVAVMGTWWNENWQMNSCGRWDQKWVAKPILTVSIISRGQL